MQEFSSTISPYLRTVRRKAFSIISFTSLTTFGALWLSLNDPNTYVSSFRILLEPINSTAKLSQASTLARTEGLPDNNLLDLDYPTQLEILKSSSILSQISDRVKAKFPGLNAANLNEDLRENLNIERITIGPSRYDWTKIFEITYQDTDPQIVNAVAEATAEQYLKYSLKERQNSINAGVSFINEQLPELKQRVATLQSRQQDLQQQHHLIDPNQKGQELFARVDELSQLKLKNKTELLELESLSDTLQQQLKLTPKQAVVALALNQNPNHQELLRQLQKIEGEIAAKSALYTANSPQVLTLKEDRDNLVTLLQQKVKPILEQHSISLANSDLVLNYQNESLLKLTQQLVDTHNQIKVLQVRDRSLQTTKQTLAKPARELPAIARQYNQLEQELALTTRILDQLLTQRETLRVEAAQEDVPWKLLGKAEVIRDSDGKPFAFPPARTKKLLGGIVGGLFLSISAAILREKRQDIFYTAEDIQDSLLLPLLGKIPSDDRFKALSAVNSNNALALVETSNKTESLFLKSFKSLYAELTFLYADNPVNSLVVSSVEPKDGQSTVVLQLAKTAAAEGKQVLLVDANLDKPQLYAQLNLPQYHRSLERVSGRRSVAQNVIYQVPEVKNLYVLTADALQDKYSTKLWSTKMQDLVAELSSNYDLVIYDSPHFLDSPDVSFLTAQTDGIVMVVGVKKTRQSLVKEAINQINAFRLPVLGVVANHIEQ